MNKRQSKRATKRRRRDEETGRQERGAASRAGRQAASPVPLAPLLRYASDHPDVPTVQPLIARQLRALQSSHGNQYVARMMSAVQRQAAPAAPAGPVEDTAEAWVAWVVPSSEAPGLSDYTVKKVAKLVKAKKRQQAIDAILYDLAAVRDVDLAKLKGRKMYYSSSVAGEGLALEPGYAKDPASGERKAKPAVVRIGRKAFTKGISWLYSSIMHEYQHVLQFQSPGAKGTSGQVSLGWLIKRQEVEAYASELMNSKKTGLFNKPKLMRETWRRLHSDHWVKLGKKSRRLLNDLYVKAYNITKKAVGPTVRLPYRPASP